MNEQINTQPILDYIRNNGLSKSEFCRQCGISVSTLDHILSQKDFRFVSLLKSASRMQVEILEFFPDRLNADNPQNDSQ